MSSKTPLVSVVMPAYNAEKYISEAIESILNQTFKDFEFIIIDDGSTDRTWEIIQEYAKKDERIVPLRNDKNLKICMTLNKGIEASRGKYIARMDSDDWSYPNRLEKQVNFLEKNTDIVVCGGCLEVSDENLNLLYIRRYPTVDKIIRRKMFMYNAFAHPSVMFRGSSLREEEYYYDPDFYDAEDYDLYFRLGKNGSFANLEDILLKYRVSSTSISYKRHTHQGLITLKVRSKAVFQYGYRIPFLSLLLQPFELIIVLLLPASVKYKLFSFMRKYV